MKKLDSKFWLICGGVLIVVLVLIFLFISFGNKKVDSNKIVTINRTNVGLKIDDTCKLYATVENGENDKVYWRSSNPDVATVGETTGMVRAVGGGNATIYAEVKSGKKIISASCDVVVTDGTISIVRVNFDVEKIDLAVGDRKFLNIKIEPENATSNELVFVSDNENVATVDEMGYVMGVGVGSTVIRVNDSKGTYDTVTVNVSRGSISGVVNPESISFSNDEILLQVGHTKVLNYILLPTNATNQTVTWQTSDSNIVRVSEGTISGVKEGTTYVSVVTSNGISDKVKVNVVKSEVAVTGIQVDSTNVSLKKDETKQINATVIPDNATNKSLTYYSSNNSIATVNSTGLITAVGVGSATIVVGVKDTSITTNVSVTVTSNSSGGGSGGGTSTSKPVISISTNSSSFYPDKGTGKVSAILSNSKYIQSSNLTITFKIESDSPLKSATYEYDFGTDHIVSSFENNKAYNLRFKDGITNFLVKVTDENNNTVTKTYYIKTDTIGPILTLSAIKESSGNTAVTFGATDSHSGLFKIYYCSSKTTSCTPTTSSYSVTTGTTRRWKYADGYRYVCSFAIDNAGNKSTSKCATILR